MSRSVLVAVLLIVLTACEFGSAPTRDTGDAAPDGSTSSSVPPVTNAEGKVTGDPFAQCVIETQSTALPQFPPCAGNPDFEWERSSGFGDVEGAGWLTEGVLLSDPSAPYITIGYRLAEGCGIELMSTRETDEFVTVGLRYGIRKGEDESIDCLEGGQKLAIRKPLRNPLGDRGLLFGRVP